MAEPKVEFGLREIHYALKGDDYATATLVAVPGAVTLTMDAEGDTSTFYADDGAYFITTTNNGKSGTMTIARANSQMLQDLLGYEKDDNGVLVEMGDKENPEFALTYQVATDLDPVRFALYGVKLGSPSQEHNTKEDSADPDTQDYDFNAIGITHEFGGESRKVIGAYCELNDATTATYNSWHTSLYLPTKAKAAA